MMDFTVEVGGMVAVIFAFGVAKSQHDSLKEKVHTLEKQIIDLENKHTALDLRIMEKLSIIAVDIAVVKDRIMKEGE